MRDSLNRELAATAANGAHRYLAPHPYLRPYIAHYTLLCPGCALAQALTLIPDASGCLVFKQGPQGMQGRFWGATTKTAVVSGEPAAYPMVFIEFRPGGAWGLSGLPQKLVTDRQIRAEDSPFPLEAQVGELLELAESLRDLAHRLDRLFLPYLTQTGAREPLPGLLELLGAQGQLLTVRDAAKASFYSERQLNRIVSNGLGMNVKMYLRLIRLNKAVQLMQSGLIRVGDLAQWAGYYDQAHFAHEFKGVCGLSPTQYLQKHTDFYHESYKF